MYDADVKFVYLLPCNIKIPTMSRIIAIAILVLACIVQAGANDVRRHIRHLRIVPATAADSAAVTDGKFSGVVRVPVFLSKDPLFDAAAFKLDGYMF